MILNLMKNLSEKNRLNKTTEIVKTVSAHFKNVENIIDPVLQLKIDVETISNVNYCQIPELGRYYFITAVTSVNNDIFEISLHCDVLKTYSEQIKSQTAVISRQENQWNLYLNDPQFQLYSNPDFTTTPFPNGFDGFQYVLLIAGF